MRLLKLEMKKILKTKSTRILLAGALILTAVMAYLPLTFVSYRGYGENGEIISASGAEAVRLNRSQAERLGISGELTPEHFLAAVNLCQSAMEQYGVGSVYELPDEAVYGKIEPQYFLVTKLLEMYSDPETGTVPELWDITEEQALAIYEQCRVHLTESIGIQEPDAVKRAEEMYDRVQTPFWYDAGSSSNAMDYSALLNFVLALFCAVIASAAFSSDYQSGADDIMRCTRYGRARLGIVKAASVLILAGILYLVCGCLYLVISNSLFGWESTKTSVQLLFSMDALLSADMGETQRITLVFSFAAFLAGISFLLFLSTRFRNTAACLAASLFSVLLPLLIYTAVPGRAGDWLCCLLPFGKLGLQNNMLYELAGTLFLNVPGGTVWAPYAALGTALAEIPVFLCLAVYCHKNRSM